MDLIREIHRICGLLLETPPNSPEFLEYRAQLKRAVARLRLQQEDWNKPSESDKHQAEPRQSYRSRETDSADGFAEGLKLFNNTKRDVAKKKD